MKKKTTKKAKVPVVAPVAPPATTSALNKGKPAPKKAKPLLTDVERIKKRLVQRHGYAEDELKTLFKTDEELIKFYNEVTAMEVDADTEKELGWDMTDSMDAPIADKERFKEQLLERQKRAFALQQAAAAKTAAPSGDPAVPVKEEGALPPVNPPVPVPTTLEEDCAKHGLTMKEFLAASEGLDDLDDILDEKE